jgi:hypothetical protein
MMKMTADALAQFMVKSEMATPDQIQGFSEEEIVLLEKKHGVNLPESYKDFLISFGKTDDAVFYSIYFTYPSLDRSRHHAYELAAANGLTLPPGAFIFLMEDSLFLFFNTEEGKDPPVYKYIEGQTIQKYADSFSQWLSDMVQAEVALDVENKKHPGIIYHGEK